MNDHERKSGAPQRPVPELLDKKFLCTYFGIPHRTSRTCRQLRAKVITDDILAALGLSEAEYKRRRQFTRRETLIIREHLQL